MKSGIFVQGGLSMPNAQELDKSKEELTGHFIEEVKVKKRIHELEQKMESVAMILGTKKGDAYAANKGGKEGGGMQTKLLAEEIDECNGQMREFKTQLDNSNTKMISLQRRRDQFLGEWRQAGHKDLAVELLGHILKENIILVENLEFQRKEQKAELQLRLKEMQLSKLSEQLKYRDDVIGNARKKLGNEGAADIDDPRIIQVEELVAQTSSFLPPINNNGSIGKASGALIKQLLEGLTHESKTKPT